MEQPRASEVAPAKGVLRQIKSMRTLVEGAVLLVMSGVMADAYTSSSFDKRRNAQPQT
jgi:hypothetical protein